MSAVPRRIDCDSVAGILTVCWPDGRVDELTHAQLRAACPCSECRAVRRAGGAIAAPPSVRLSAVEPVGHYALNLVFDDGHGRGIYPYTWLADAAATSAW